MVFSRALLRCVTACLFIAACGSDDPSGDDGGRGGTSSTGGAAGAPSAEGGAGGSEPGAAASLCDGADLEKAVALSPDGSRVAFVACAEGAAAVFVRDLGSGKETPLGPVTAEARVEWLLDGETVLFGSAEALSARVADGSREGTRIGSARVDEHLAFLERVGQDFVPRLMVLETDTDTRRVVVYKTDDGYTTQLVLLDDPTLVGDLSHLSDSGRTLVPTLRAEDGTEVYSKVRTDGTIPAKALSFGPADWVLAPIGLGDTHDFAVQGDQLVRVELDTGKLVELVPAGAGLLPGMDHIFDREDEPGKKFVYYIQNGDPTRRLRDGTDEPLILAEANATAHKLSADTNTLLYLSDGQLYAVPAGGGDSTLLVAEVSDETRLAPALSATLDEFGYRIGASLYRVSLTGLTSEVVASDLIEPSRIAYDGLGQALVFLDNGRLQRVAPGATEPEVLHDSVEYFWPVPKSAALLIGFEGQLELLEP